MYRIASGQALTATHLLQVILVSYIGRPKINHLSFKKRELRLGNDSDRFVASGDLYPQGWFICRSANGGEVVEDSVAVFDGNLLHSYGGKLGDLASWAYQTSPAATPFLVRAVGTSEVHRISKDP